MTQIEFYTNWERDLERAKENYQRAIKSIENQLKEVRLNLKNLLEEEIKKN